MLHYFPNKINLLQHVLDYRDQESIKQLSEAFALENMQLENMTGALESLVSQNEKTPALIRLFTVLVGESIRADHPSQDFFVNRYALGRQQYAALFNTLAEQGDLDPNCDFEQLANVIMAVMDGLQIQWLLDPDTIDMAASFELFSKILVHYLEK